MLKSWCLLFACLGLFACGRAHAPLDQNPLSKDKRISKLLQGGRQTYYDRDTQNMLPILVQKLRDTGGDPLHRAKEELGDMGSEAALELRRMFDENFTNQQGIPFLENAVDAASLNGSMEAHDLVLAGLDHPMEAVRQRCLSALVTKHARPEDFQELRRRFETNDSFEVRQQCLRALFRADRERAEDVVLAWIQRAEFAQFHSLMYAGLKGSKRPATGLMCGLLYAQAAPIYRCQLAATAARFGDAAALDYVRAELKSKDPSTRVRATLAFGSVEMYAELQDAVSAPGPPNTRLIALQNLAEGAEGNPEIQGWMATGLFDPNVKVRDYALAELCKVSYRPALDQAMAQLKGGVELLQPALSAMRSSLEKDPELASRALAIMTQRYGEEVAALDEHHGRTLKAIGMIPGRASAEFLRKRALELGDTLVDGLNIHTWVMIAASNTGPEGLQYLFECLQEEQDPTRRIDLIDAVSSVREARSRERLFELLDTEQDPYEALFTAVQAIQIGPSRLVAPRIQKYCFGLKHVESRQALQAMMWKWY